MATRYPPGPTRSLPNLLGLARDAPGFLLRLGEHGDIAHFRIGPRHAYLLKHPDLIKEVLLTQNKSFTKGMALQGARRLLGDGLLTNEGEHHKRQRKLLQPHFHHQHIKAYAGAMVEYGGRWRDRWQPGQRVDMLDEMADLTLSIIGRTLFDVDLETEGQELRQALADALESFNRIGLPVAARLEKLPLPVNRRFRRAKATLDRLVYQMIEERKGAGAASKARGDMLSLLVGLRYEGEDRGMSDLQIRDEAVTIFLAGHDTTAGGLTMTWYYLAQNSQVEARLHEELDRVLGGRAPTLEDYPKLDYTRRVFAEGLRIHPPAWVLGRQAIEDVSIGGYDLPKGSIVLLSQLVTHHDERWWPSSWTFDPDRFLPEKEAARPKLSYFPFGAGPRVCIGEPFAWMEATLLLATLAQRWRPRVAPGFKLAYTPTLTLKPRGGMPMVLERRDESRATG